MNSNAFPTEPAGGLGWARHASAQVPLLDQEFDSGTLYALRAAVQAHVGQAGLSEDRADEVVLAVHELAANAIAHGAGHGRLLIWDLTGALSCEVVDGGRANADGPPRLSETADPWPAEIGHGLWLVRQMADHLDLRSGPRGTRAIINFARPLPGDH